MLQHTQLITRAKQLGIAVTDVSRMMQCDTAILEYNGISELVMNGIPTSWINVRSQFYCDNKQLTKLAYEALGIPHPKSIVFLTPDEPDLGTFMEKNRLYVCKPLDNTNGIGVGIHLDSLEKVKTHFEAFAYLKEPFMLEEQIAGKDLRIHVIGGKIVAACIREPAFVVGNGTDTLKMLIEKRRAVIHKQNPNNSLEIDEATTSLLTQQQIKLSDIPQKDRKIQLKHISNMAQGGVATDVTDEIHTVYQDWAAALSGYLKTGYMGLDFITTDHSAQPTGHSWLLEINARADWLHHTFSERKTHDMAGLILEKVFGIT